MSANDVSQHPDIGDAWIAEAECFEFDEEILDAALCAELADELSLFKIQADADPNFWDTYSEWDEFILANSLWLPIEQCCHDGVLLPMDQRVLRVKTCPQELLRPLGRFFEVCPAHVKHQLALTYALMVRIDRARRTGNADWRPETAAPRSAFHNSVFFCPPILTFRKYTG